MTGRSNTMDKKTKAQQAKKNTLYSYKKTAEFKALAATDESTLRDI